MRHALHPSPCLLIPHAAAAACRPTAKKREMDDNSRRIGALFWKLNEGQVAGHVLPKLMQLCGALDAGNWPAAAHIQVRGGLRAAGCAADS